MENIISLAVLVFFLAAVLRSIVRVVPQNKALIVERLGK